MTIPELPWWPPKEYEVLTDQQAWELFTYLLPQLPPLIDAAAQHIRERVADAPIHFQLLYPTTKSLTGRRLGLFDVLEIAELSAQENIETVSISIGIHRDGQLATKERRTFQVDRPLQGGVSGTG